MSTQATQSVWLHLAYASIERWNRGSAPVVDAQTAGILLFGSHAKGKARVNSDLDFLIVVPEHARFNGESVLQFARADSLPSVSAATESLPTESSLFDVGSLALSLEKERKEAPPFWVFILQEGLVLTDPCGLFKPLQKRAQELQNELFLQTQATVDQQDLELERQHLLYRLEDTRRSFIHLRNSFDGSAQRVRTLELLKLCLEWQAWRRIQQDVDFSAENRRLILRAALECTHQRVSRILRHVDEFCELLGLGDVVAFVPGATQSNESACALLDALLTRFD
ncbi:MAG: nucleotidyltransferase domain-containing protein [Silvanigrellales bacterium]|nr:nucleotidyltransferase domain-containing protein [Silvanigrellales bacterium]